jgi:hypothetical protein
MQVQASLPLSRRRERPESRPSIRGPQAAVLTACAAAIGIAFGLTLGPTAVLLYVLTLPVPMLLLWLSADVRRSDER